MTPSEVIAQARIVLNDPSAVRWADSALLGFVNDAIKELTMRRTDLASRYQAIALDAGELQSLPAAQFNALINVLKNKDARSVREVDFSTLQNQNRSWRALSRVGVECFAKDPTEPRRFLVYPPAEAAEEVSALVSVVLGDYALADVTGLPATYRAALSTYVAGRALAVNTNAADVEKGRVLIAQAMEMM